MEQINIYIRRANQLHDLGRYQECIIELHKALQLNPNHIPALRLLLISKINAQHPVAQLKKLALRVLSVNPDDDTAHYTMGLVFQERSNYKKSKEHFEEALSYFPDNVDYLIALSETYRLMDDHQYAKELIDEALSYEPDNIKVLSMKSHLDSLWFKYNDAENAIEQALNNDPNNAGIHFQSGQVAMANMQHKKAKEHFTTAIQLDPTDEDTKLAYLNSILSQFYPYRLLFSKYNIFHPVNSLGRLVFIIMFIVIILLLKTKIDPSSIYHTIGYWSSWGLFAIHFLYWFIAPIIRYGLSKRKWGVAHFEFRSYEIYLKLSIQMMLLSAFYFFLTEDYRGLTTAFFLGMYGLSSAIIFFKENRKVKQTLICILIAIYILGFSNLILSILGYKFRYMEMIAGLAWIILIIGDDAISKIDQKLSDKE